MDIELPNYLVPTTDEQNAVLAELLGTTPDRLCPGLKNLSIYKFLDKNDPDHQAYVESMVENAKNLPLGELLNGKNYVYMLHFQSHMEITPRDVEDCWLKFASGIQYGYEQGPVWDIPNKPNFLVCSTEDNIRDRSVWYLHNENFNWVMMAALFLLEQTAHKKAPDLAAQRDTMAIHFLMEHPNLKYPADFDDLAMGLEEIRHAQQCNNHELNSFIKEQEKIVYPDGRPDKDITPKNSLVSVVTIDRSLYGIDPMEVEAAEFVAKHFDGAVERFKETQTRLNAPKLAALKDTWEGRIIEEHDLADDGAGIAIGGSSGSRPLHAERKVAGLPHIPNVVHKPSS